MSAVTMPPHTAPMSILPPPHAFPAPMFSDFNTQRKKIGGHPIKHEMTLDLMSDAVCVLDYSISTPDPMC